MATPRPKPIEEGTAPRVLGSPWLDHDTTAADHNPQPAALHNISQANPEDAGRLPWDIVKDAPWTD